MVANVTPGVVEITALPSGWYSVAIGRTSRHGVWTKRFNLSDAEARQLVEKLTEILPS